MKNIYFILMALLITVSCVNEGTNTGDNPQDSTSIDSTKITKQKQTFYKIPSSIELYFFLKEEGIKFKKEALNSVDNVNKYNTTASKAINFGIYASDLAYCSLYEKNQETALYYSTLKKLADDLGLMKGFDESITKRIEKNMNNSDSVFQIATEAYWNAFNFLESQDKTNILPYITIGNWIESVYITIQSLNKFSVNNPLIGRVLDQDLLLDNLLSYLETADNKAQLKDYITKLNDIKQIIEEKYNNKDGKITKKQYEKITNKIIAFRKELIS